jgi:carbonic anhydrase
MTVDSSFDFVRLETGRRRRTWQVCRGGPPTTALRRSDYDLIVPGDETFADVLAANEGYARQFPHRGLQARAARGLAVLTCIDSRIEPLATLGLGPGDAKILRNAGARVTGDVLRSLVLASHLLGVNRVMIVAHTDCRMTGTDEDVRAELHDAGAPDTRELDFLMTEDQAATVRSDVQLLRESPYLAHLRVGGFRYDVETGRLSQLC